MAKHVPHHEPRSLWQWIKDARLQRKFRREIQRSEAYKEYREFMDDH